ncbi:ABC transporter substrate-binding protein [Motilimonas eburnea]|uniref:ABC transporter substrate-binding protein n=1 Tax=Motilimonas eburnea TaxID=1737488 RepID=UPI001E459E1E|nr:ABC transporter substrate-binding protein [Motilimonas eburnea]MCE2570601.1 ABC transporter substrate-binding protein [Motilimonas eburnea]
MVRAAMACVGIVLVVIFSRPFWYAKPSVDSAPVKPVIRIAVSQTPLTSAFFVAEDKGIFRAKGLNVELVPCRGGVKCVDMLLENKADLATASETVFMFRSFQHANLKLITSFVESSNDLKLLTLKDQKINTVDDLVGTKVGVIKGSSSEFFLDSLLILNGLDSGGVEKLFYSPSQLVSALLNQEVNAISVWEPFGYELNTMLPEQVLQLQSEGVYNLSFNLITQQESMPSQTDISALLDALEQANLLLVSHPKRSQTLVSEYLNVPFNQLSWSWPDYLFRLSLGNALLSNLQTQARWAIDQGLVEQHEIPDYRAMLLRLSADPISAIVEAQ